MIQNDVRKFSKEDRQRGKDSHTMSFLKTQELTAPLARAFYAYLEDSILCLMRIMQNGITNKEFWK